MSVKSVCRASAKAEDGKSSRAYSGIKFTTKRPMHMKSYPYEGREVTFALDKDGIRKLLVPSKEAIARPKIISSAEYQKMIERSRKPTKEEKEAALAVAEQEKERLLRECMARKETIRRMDLKKNREKQGRLTEIEEEAKQRTMHLLERARELRLEQEEEIKKCNKLIIETKCRAIRDAQIAEKKMLEEQFAREEQLLNERMEQERLNAIRADEEKERERVESKLRFAQVLKEQILRNEEERLLEYERKREECRLVNLNSIAQQEAEIEKLKEKEAEHERVRNELIQCNEQLKHFKAMEREEQRIMDTRIQEFHREKAEREAKLAEEIRLENQRKEREKERLAEQALQASEVQAQIDELNSSRVQEEVEREWRRKEKENAIKRIETQNKLRSIREAQINNKMQLQAMEIEREKREFEKILAMQREALCQEEKKQQEKRKQSLIHRSEILKQVNAKEKERIVARQKMFEEGLAIRSEIEERNRRLREAMERKCQEMKETRVPDMYINDIKRMIENIK